MAGNTASARAQPSRRPTRLQTTKNLSGAATDDQIPTFSSIQANNFFSMLTA